MSKICRIIAVTSSKGGVGKTTTALALAHGLARTLAHDERRQSVLLVDLDPRAQCAPSLGIEPQRCVGDLLLGQARPEEVIMPADRGSQGAPARPNLYLLPATSRLATARAQLLANAAVHGLLGEVRRAISDEQQTLSGRHQRLFAELRQVFAFIVVDYPSPLDLLWQAVYHGVDGCVVPVRSDYLSVRSAVAQWKAPADDGVWAVVPTFVRRQVLAEQSLAELRRHFGSERLSPAVPASVRVAEAPSARGQTVFEYAPGSTAARAYQSLVEQIYDRI